MTFSLKFVAAALAGCLLVSCIDGREEYWINSRGGGRAKLNYTLPAFAAEFQGGEAGIRTLLADFLNGNTAFTSSNSSVTREGNLLRVTVEVEFKSARDLQKLSAQSDEGKMSELPAAAKYMSGKTDLQLRGLALDFTRTIEPGKALPGFRFLPKRELEGKRLVYIMHLPTAANESNATRTADGGKTLVWDISLRDALAQPVVTHFKAPLPLPRWLLALAGLVMVGGCWLVLRWRRKRRRAA